MAFAKIISISKFIFVTILFISLVTFFLRPSLRRYWEKGTVFVDENVDFDMDSLPAIVVTRGNPEYGPLIEHCLNSSDDYESAVLCIDKKLLTNEQIILEEGKSNHHKMFTAMSLGSWRMDFDEHLWRGKRYMLEKYHLEPTEWLDLGFSNETIVMEFIDPKFYLLSYKYLTMPKLMFSVEPGKKYYLEIVSEHFHLLNRPLKPCVSSEEYSFTKCVEVINMICPVFSCEEAALEVQMLSVSVCLFVCLSVCGQN